MAQESCKVQQNPDNSTAWRDPPCAAARLYISKARWKVSCLSNKLLSSETVHSTHSIHVMKRWGDIRVMKRGGNIHVMKRGGDILRHEKRRGHIHVMKRGGNILHVMKRGGNIHFMKSRGDIHIHDMKIGGDRYMSWKEEGTYTCHEKRRGHIHVMKRGGDIYMSWKEEGTYTCHEEQMILKEGWSLTWRGLSSGASVTLTLQSQSHLVQWVHQQGTVHHVMMARHSQ